MASSKEHLDFILEQLSGLDEIAYRGMISYGHRRKNADKHFAAAQILKGLDVLIQKIFIINYPPL